MSHTKANASEFLSIRAVAQRTGLSAHTLRYYERIGLIEAVSRQASGHRLYACRDLDWIAFLMRLRATGMPIAQMLEFAALRRQGPASVAARRALLEAHQATVRSHIAELSANLAVLDDKVAFYRRQEAGPA